MILYLCDAAADYGADYLADGFYSLLGADQVIDWPPKPSLHAGERLLFDCDLAWPEHGWSELQVVEALRDRSFDLIVVPTLRGRVPGWLGTWNRMGLLERNADRIVCVDGEDHSMDLRLLYGQAIGFEPQHFFKRELPLGEEWATPLPFGYPERRIVPVGNQRAPLAFYAVQIWPWAVGALRERLGDLLQRNEGGVPALVRLSYGEQRSYPPEGYHREAQQCRVGIAPAGMGYFTNRLFELVADGCVLIAEAPTMQFPGAFVDPIECRYFRNEFEAVEMAVELVRDVELAKQIAEAGQVALRERHTTACRARTVWASVYE